MSNLNFPRLVILFGLLGSAVLGYFVYERTEELKQIESNLKRAPELVSEIQSRALELNALKQEDFVRILTEPAAALTTQYVALMRTEGVKLSFAEDGIARIAEIACEVNESAENIGARRLHTVLERLLEGLSFTADASAGAEVVVDAGYVNANLADLLADQDLAKYIL